jgi:hypothetical protein
MLFTSFFGTSFRCGYRIPVPLQMVSQGSNFTDHNECGAGDAVTLNQLWELA